ncbi:MAG: hypothetical protein ACP6IY_21280 [Promethearchaeia archaeon]
MKFRSEKEEDSSENYYEENSEDYFDLEWTESIIKLPEKLQKKAVRNRKARLIILTLSSAIIAFFATYFIFITILMKDIGFNVKFILISITLFFIVESATLIIIIFRQPENNDFNIKFRLIEKFIGAAIVFAFLFYIFFIDSSLNVIKGLKYAAQENYSLIFPAILIFFIIFNAYSILSDYGINIESFIERLRLRKFEDYEFMLMHRTFNHIKFSLLVLLISDVLMFYGRISIEELAFYSIFILAVFNMIYFKVYDQIYKKFKERKLKRKDKKYRVFSLLADKNHSEERKEEIKELGRRALYYTIFIIAVFIIIGTLYYLDILGIKSLFISLGILIFSNQYLLALGIINLFLIVIIPVGLELFILSLKFLKFCYEKGIKKIILVILAYFSAVFAIKILFFNNYHIGINEGAEWLISYAVPSILFIIKFIAKKAIKKLTVKIGV